MHNVRNYKLKKQKKIMKTFALFLCALLVLLGVYFSILKHNLAGLPMVLIGSLSFTILSMSIDRDKRKPVKPNNTNNVVLTLLGIGITIAIIAAVAYSPNVECMTYCR